MDRSFSSPKSGTKSNLTNPANSSEKKQGSILSFFGKQKNTYQTLTPTPSIVPVETVVISDLCDSNSGNPLPHTPLRSKRGSNVAFVSKPAESSSPILKNQSPANINQSVRLNPTKKLRICLSDDSDLYFSSSESEQDNHVVQSESDVEEESSGSDFQPVCEEQDNESIEEEEEEEEVMVKTLARKLERNSNKSNLIVPQILETQLSNLRTQFSINKMRSNLNNSVGGKENLSVITTKATLNVIQPPSLTRDDDENEDRYKWLIDVKDAQKRSCEDPDFDKTTIYVPPYAWQKFTPFERQYWEIKCINWDIIVFFKKGKFYELYEKDALIGNKEFDLKLTDRVNMPMAGVPEKNFSVWATKFISRGYKVAQVDEAESNLEKTMREKKNPGVKKSSIISRKLTQIYTIGTLLGDMVINEESNYIMSVIIRDHQAGVIFLEASTSMLSKVSFSLSQDTTFSQLETLILQISPKEIILEKSESCKSILECIKHTKIKVQTTFIDSPGLMSSLTTNRDVAHNPLMREIKLKCKPLTQQAKDKIDKFTLSITHQNTKCTPELCAFAMLITYLDKLNIITQTIEIMAINDYDILNTSQHLILDGQSLTNLEILVNNETNQIEGSLLSLFNRNKTAFGKRMFVNWLCHPLKSISAINARYDAIEDIFEYKLGTVFLNFKIPDLERALVKISTKTIKPDEFIQVLTTFDLIYSGIKAIQRENYSFKSKFLSILFSNYKLVSEKSIYGSVIDHAINHAEHSKIQSLPDLEEIIASYIDQLSYSKVYVNAAESTQIACESTLSSNNSTATMIIPKPGTDSAYDRAMERVNELKSLLQDHLREVQSQLKISTQIKYKDIGSELYQIEVPSHINVPNNFILKSQTKAVKRYWTPFIAIKHSEFAEAKIEVVHAQSQVYMNILTSFSAHIPNFKLVINSISIFDCLNNLAQSSLQLGLNGKICRPVLIDSDEPMLLLEEMMHPCASLSTTSATEFIPNSVLLGDTSPALMVLTGPNMGGKSTLLRQTCIAVLLAQLGCFLPAKSCTLSPVDRIFTRIGANDNIIAGQSTFMVELNETSTILKHATRKSLVILDELGRGTSTFDGYAIAYAVIKELVDFIKCRAIFSTHYHLLCNELQDEHSNIALHYMSYEAEKDSHHVTFLYKLVEGICPKSFGMNVALMAGFSHELVSYADTIAKKFERTNQSLFTEKKARLLLVSKLKNAIRNRDINELYKLKGEI